MNLINDEWIPVIRENRKREKIAPWQIAETHNPVVEIAAPRPDFQGGLYQFLIGLLQSTFVLKNTDDWLKHFFTPPTLNEMQENFDKVATAFELYAPDSAPAFLQEYSFPEPAKGSGNPISYLLIDAPGEKTCKDNLDHFVKRDAVTGMCESCTATALFTLQTNAPAGGQGHRVGLRGGGPLTTLLVPEDDNASLWRKLWLNVFVDDDYFNSGVSPVSEGVFPWMGPTRLSDKSGGATLPGDVHLLQMYWGMPRRLRLEPSESSGVCGLCGDHDRRLFSSYRTEARGINYEGPWRHPLTPYREDPKQNDPPGSLKGQKGGLGYRHWLSLAFKDPEKHQTAARVVQSYAQDIAWMLEEKGVHADIWCFGYDMDNMKARCWYEQRMPTIFIDDDEDRELFIHCTTQLITAAGDVVGLLQRQVKAAWFSRPADVKGDTSMIAVSFWNATEEDFYRQLSQLKEHIIQKTRTMPPEVAGDWLNIVTRHARELFDYWVLEGNAEDMNMKRIIRARLDMYRKLKSHGSLKNLEQKASIGTESA